MWIKQFSFWVLQCGFTLHSRTYFDIIFSCYHGYLHLLKGNNLKSFCKQLLYFYFWIILDIKYINHELNVFWLMNPKQFYSNSNLYINSWKYMAGLTTLMDIARSMLPSIYFMSTLSHASRSIIFILSVRSKHGKHFHSYSA